jgi:hypothetical protein
MIYIAVVIGVIVITIILSPFFVGAGGLLAAGASINSPSRLEAIKAAVLKRYVEDEAAFQAGDLSRLAWDKRRAFLVNRYVDTVRRLDYLKVVAQEERAG